MKTVDVQKIVRENITCRYFADCSTCNVGDCNKEKMLDEIEKEIKQGINSLLDELAEEITKDYFTYENLKSAILLKIAEMEATK